MRRLAVVCPNFIEATKAEQVVPVLGDQLGLDRLAEQRAGAGSARSSWDRAGMGRMNASWPLAVLTAHGQDVVLRFRPAVLARMFGVTEPFAWHISDVITAYPVRGRLVALSYGLAIESTTTPLAYFWTARPAAILADLSARGVPVDWTKRYVKLLS